MDVLADGVGSALLFRSAYASFYVMPIGKLGAGMVPGMWIGPFDRAFYAWRNRSIVSDALARYPRIFCDYTPDLYRIKTHIQSLDNTLLS